MDNIHVNISDESIKLELDKTSGILLNEIIYLDKNNSVCSHEVQEHQLIKIDRDDFVFGYVTKINGLRWGVNLFIDRTTGKARIKTDIDSPIVALRISIKS